MYYNVLSYTRLYYATLYHTPSRASLLRVLESNFPGDPLSNSTDMRIPTPEN